mgnify:CR=1 FL=1
MTKREYKYEWDVLYIKCPKCWEFKTIDEYNKSKLWAFWTVWRCKVCVSSWNHKYYDSKAKQQQDYYWNNKERINAHKREYYLKTQKHKKYRDKMTEELWFNRHTFHVKACDYVNEHSLRPERCSICGSCGTIEMHHPSYEKYEYWSMVVFCCKSCHRQIHSWRIKCPSPINLLDWN